MTNTEVLEQLIGKTIKDINQGCLNDCPLSIVFTDGTSLECQAIGDDATYLECEIVNN